MNFDEMITVAVCSKCGKGFPPWSEMLSAGIDNQPIWFTTTQREDFCNGRIIHIERADQIARVAFEEFMSGEQWTAEQIAEMDLARPPIRTNNERDAGRQIEGDRGPGDTPQSQRGGSGN